jgi:hypothetical protein
VAALSNTISDFHVRQGISRLANSLLGLQDSLCFMEVSLLNKHCVSDPGSVDGFM